MDAVTPADTFVEKKRRTITLTNRGPISIIEADWPIIAQGTCGEEAPSGSPYEDWEITFRVRLSRHGRTIIHANYSFSCEVLEQWHKARVGRLLNIGVCDDEACKALLEVGDELRARINPEGMRKYVTYALDACFAQMPVQILV